MKAIAQDIGFECVIGLVYGPHSIGERRILWDELRGVRDQFNVPCLMMGDFNEILKVDDR